MHKKLIFVLIITIFSINVYSQEWVEMMQNPNVPLQQVSNAFSEYWSVRPYERGKGYKQFKRWEYMRQSRVDSNGIFAQTESSYFIYKKLVKENTAKGTSGPGAWKHLGPFGSPMNSGAGRLNCFAFHPDNANFILAGAASGGVWVTTDGGNSWKTYTDELASLGISDIVFNPKNPSIVYAASGDRDASDAYSIGVLKSTNGGYNWDTTGLNFTIEQKKLVNKLLINPINPDILYAATGSGIYKTVNAGVSWKLLRPGAFKDIAMRPGDTNTIYSVSETAFLKSTNAGTSWQSVSLNNTVNIKGLRIGVTAADSNYVYIVAGLSSSAGFGGIFLSTDAGVSFTQKASSPNLLGWQADGSDSGGQAWYDLSISVSQSNKNQLFVGGVNIWKSINAGQSWNISAHWTGANGKPYVHADIHALYYSPHSTSVIWAASDGGAFKATSNGISWTEFNNGLGIGQIYRLGASATDAGKIMTGFQDNGSNLLWTNIWKRALGGDGMECIIDPSNSNIMYGELYYGAISRSDNNGSDWTGITSDITETGAWVTPYVINPQNPKSLIAGYTNVWKTTNRGDNWTKISNFTNGGTLSIVQYAPSDTNVIYAATPYYMYVTVNHGQTWKSIAANTGSGNFTGIAIHPENPYKIWITKSGFYANEKVYTSADTGSTWTNVSGNLPNVSANCIVYEKNTSNGIYVGMDVGVYYIDDTKTSWVPFINGLPNVIVDELEIYYPTKKIRAATYGRGLWESYVISIADGISENQFENEMIQLYPNPAKSKIRLADAKLSMNNASVEIINASGQRIKVIENFNSNEDIDISFLSEGTYFVKITNELKTYNAKFIKQ